MKNKMRKSIVLLLVTVMLVSVSAVFPHTVKAATGSGTVWNDPYHCYTFAEFKYAMESTTIIWITLEALSAAKNEEYLSIPGSQRDAIVQAPNTTKDVYISGNATFLSLASATDKVFNLIKVNANSTLYINGSPTAALTFKAADLTGASNAVIYNNGGTVSITGGTIIGSYHTTTYGRAVYQQSGVLNISYSPTLISDAYYPFLLDMAALYVKGGTVNISGGNFLFNTPYSIPGTGLHVDPYPSSPFSITVTGGFFENNTTASLMPYIAAGYLMENATVNGRTGKSVKLDTNLPAGWIPAQIYISFTDGSPDENCAVYPLVNNNTGTGWAYDPPTGTLTLADGFAGESIRFGYVSGYVSTMTYTIKLAGTASLVTNTNAISMNEAQNLIITGPGTLNITRSSDDRQSYFQGINTNYYGSGQGNVLINSGTVNITNTYTGPTLSQYGISIDKPGGSFTVSGTANLNIDLKSNTYSTTQGVYSDSGLVTLGGSGTIHINAQTTHQYIYSSVGVYSYSGGASITNTNRVTVQGTGGAFLGDINYNANHYFISPNTQAAKTFTYTVGKPDVNDDGYANALDITALKKHLLGITTLSQTKVNEIKAPTESGITVATLVRYVKLLMGI